MYCSACGTAIPEGQAACPQCGQQTVIAPPPGAVPPATAAPVPGFDYELMRYGNGLRALSICWFVYAALILIAGFVGMAFARHFLAPGWGPWSHGEIPPWWLHMVLSAGWTMILFRAALAAAAGVGLMEHAPWGKIVAIVAAILTLIHIPLGTALGIWTLVMLLGCRHSTFYEQL